MSERPLALIQGFDLWSRAVFEDTDLDPDDAVVRLAYLDDAPAEEGDDEGIDLPPLLGLARDPWCRIYIALADEGRVLRLTPRAGQPDRLEILFAPASEMVGDFQLEADPGAGLVDPVALAVDNDGRLFIVEGSARRLRLFDLLDRRLLRTVQLPHEVRAMGSDGELVLLLSDARLGRLDAFSEPEFFDLPEAAQGADAMALDTQGVPWLLLDRGSADARVLPLRHRPGVGLVAGDATSVPRASALVWRDGELIVARGPGESFRRFQDSGRGMAEDAPLDAPGYLGNGIILDSEGRVRYWSGSGLARVRPTRRRFVPRGRVTGFALDAGDFQNTWGRLFIDACIPKGTRLLVHCLTLDDLPPGELRIAPAPPANYAAIDIPHAHRTPPLPPAELVADIEPAQILHKRAGGRELAWSDPELQAPFETYEAPVVAAPGRWLWVVLELIGGARATPRVRGLRTEIQGHDLMRRLPRVYSTDPGPADFLQRWLATLDGPLHGLELQAAARHLLLDPAATPAEALPWLAGFVGLALDQRWSEAARRTLIKEANWLFRFRGTVPGLTRMLAIYLELDESRPPVIIEHFKVRGLGGALVGSSDALASNSVLGAGFRVGGTLGSDNETSVLGQSLDAAVDTAAHRFTVVLPLQLDQEQMAVVESILDQHRPAHTLYDICSLDAGMRIGFALYAGLTSLIGRGSGFGVFSVGGSLLGRQDLVGGGPRYSGVLGRIGGIRVEDPVAEAADWRQSCQPTGPDRPGNRVPWVGATDCGGGDA